jgi:exodeoxyribonuclease VII small subunit
VIHGLKGIKNKHSTIMEEKTVSYRMAIEEIESILKKIENQALDVDDLSSKLKRVNELVKICKKKLFTAEEEVEKILGEMDPSES